MIKKYFYTSFGQSKKFCAMHWLKNNKAHFWTFDKNVKKIEMILHTLPTAEILSEKNARAWISMVLYLKNIYKNIEAKKKIMGAA